MIRWDLESSKKYYIAGAVGLAIIASLFSLIPSRTKIHVPVAPEKIGYSYEMPRIETAEIPFDLSGRRVIRKYPESPQQTAAVPFVKQVIAPIVKTNGTSGKAFPKIKKETAQEKAARQAKEKAKKLTEARKKNHRVQVVTASDRFKMKPETEKPNPPKAVPQPVYVYSPPLPPPTVDDPAIDKKDDDVLDPSTWQSLLQNQPNAANIAKFMKARSEGKLPDAAFYRIVTVLLQDRAPDRQKAALQILDQDTSPKTYEFIVVGALTLPGDVPARLRTLQAKYTTPSKIFLLGRVLASTTNKTVLLAALLQLNQAASTSGPLPQPGQPTGPSTGIHAQLNSMLGILRKVATNPDPNVSAQAKALLSSLQKA